MACLIVDHDNEQPFDILPSRKSIDLIKYFSKFSKSALDNVEVVTMDMYDPYISIAKKFFKNATIIFDKFHVVQNFTRALNQTRIAYMNTLDTNDIKYKHLKKYWKSLLSFSIKPSSNHYSLPLFERKTNINNVVNTLIEYDEQLNNNYNC